MDIVAAPFRQYLDYWNYLSSLLLFFYIDFDQCCMYLDDDCRGSVSVSIFCRCNQTNQIEK
ncbi:hypothetical protein DERP_006707 [Dermatophagoides pteronyssinus]|uniref:Uncharacterized protein n=1 Tax=Dermatophagoides pteronyssinus TaxID=6956 RepID=A0ABQ8IS57_DERPT|nr:hypothetical protein DERP_006707 [Dermatophagoides pteronyssinus]